MHTTAGARVSERKEEKEEEEEEEIRGCTLETRMEREEREEGGRMAGEVVRRPTWKQPCVHPGEEPQKASNFIYIGEQVTVTDL